MINYFLNQNFLNQKKVAYRIMIILWVCIKLTFILAMATKNPANFIYGGF